MSVLHNQPKIQSAAAASAIKGGKLLDLSFDMARSFLSLESEYPELKGLDNAAKREFAVRKTAEFHKKANSLRRDLARREKASDGMKREVRIMDRMLEWMDSSPRLEKPSAPHFRDMRRAVADGEALYLHMDNKAVLPATDYEKEVFRFAHVMVVEHDWSAALDGSGTDGAPINLPYDLCAFEFQYSGVPVIVFATSMGSETVLCQMAKIDGVWTLPAFCSSMDNSDMAGDISKQIRAVCIALDAGIAYSEVRREPSGHAGVNTGQLRDYNVVSLASRSRALPANSVKTGKRVRLHFRRGHWRHFDGSKTWIKWMLVGDPDLGFVDKHYRL